MTNLTAMDVRALTQEPSVKVRQLLASKIALDFRNNDFSPSESAIAIDIFRILIHDAEIKIRQSVSEQLAHCPNAPHDIIWKLANDDADVSIRVLEHSTVLTEDDLIAITQSTYEVVKLCAIARRQYISEDLAGNLLETSNTTVMQQLFGNKGAALNVRQLMKAWDKISAHATLLETLVHRGNLPITIAEKLFLAVSDEMKQTLNEHYKLSKPLLNKVVNDAYEWELLGLPDISGSGIPTEDEMVEDLVDDLHAKGRLTQSLLIRALCLGNLKVFETGIARLANVPRVNARILLLESSGLGLEAIYKAAHMPEGFLEAIKILLRLSLEETDLGETTRADFRKRIIDRIYIEKYNLKVDNMEYLLSIIGGKTFASADVD